jgi:hypothetical protein
MNFHCYGCTLTFEAEDLNLSLIHVSCPICNTRNEIAASLGRSYPALEREVRGIMSRLAKVCNGKKAGDCSTVIWAAYSRIKSLTEAAQ